MIRRVLLIGVALAVLGFGGTWVYLNLIRDDAPERLSLSDDPDRSDDQKPARREGIEGRWSPTEESQVGYRVKEVIFAQAGEGVGRTSAVTGELTIEGTTVEEAGFEADLRTLKSDESQRDDQVRGRILDTARFPTATFELTEPIELDAEPAVGQVVTKQATGELTVRDTKKSVTFDLQAKYTGSTIEIAGAIPVVFAEWNIPNPSNFVAATEDRGLIEFLLVLEPA